MIYPYELDKKSGYPLRSAFFVKRTDDGMGLGVYTKKYHRKTYDDAYVTDEFNYIKAMTAGFEEPYALSFFMGDVVTFTNPKGERESKNKGYLGYLLSLGDKHIKDNEIIDEEWYELEIKVKGDRDFDTHKLGYSFRLGIKMHEKGG